MSPPNPTVLLLLLLISLAATCSSAVSSPLVSFTNDTSVYQILEYYNFPPGLLPKGAKRYDIDPSTGKFTVYFDGTCSFSLEGSYDIRYKSQISGQISTNEIRDLSGISVKILFLWVNIVEVSRRNDELEFSVGIASAGFTIENFYEIPQCGCGLNCANRDQDPNPIRSSLRLRGSF